MNKKKVLVTGSEGFIGSHLVNYLCSKKLSIIATHYKKVEKNKK
jgi:nucleoside-diphosphate-sugar epimerase